VEKEALTNSEVSVQLQTEDMTVTVVGFKITKEVDVGACKVAPAAVTVTVAWQTSCRL
jgi:hypothetical protein